MTSSNIKFNTTAAAGFAGFASLASIAMASAGLAVGVDNKNKQGKVGNNLSSALKERQENADIELPVVDGLTPGQYKAAVLNVDTKGLVKSVSDGTVVTSVNSSSTPLQLNTVGTGYSLGLAAVPSLSGSTSVHIPTLQCDQYGRVTNISENNDVLTEVSSALDDDSKTPIYNVNNSAGTLDVGLHVTGVVAGDYKCASHVTSTHGRFTRVESNLVSELVPTDMTSTSPNIALGVSLPLSYLKGQFHYPNANFSHLMIPNAIIGTNVGGVEYATMFNSTFPRQIMYYTSGSNKLIDVQLSVNNRLMILLLLGNTLYYTQEVTPGSRTFYTIIPVPTGGDPVQVACICLPATEGNVTVMFAVGGSGPDHPVSVVTNSDVAGFTWGTPTAIDNSVLNTNVNYCNFCSSSTGNQAGSGYRVMVTGESTVGCYVTTTDFTGTGWTRETGPQGSSYIYYAHAVPNTYNMAVVVRHMSTEYRVSLMTFNDVDANRPEFATVTMATNELPPLIGNSLNCNVSITSDHHPTNKTYYVAYVKPDPSSGDCTIETRHLLTPGAAINDKNNWSGPSVVTTVATNGTTLFKSGRLGSVAIGVDKVTGYVHVSYVVDGKQYVKVATSLPPVWTSISEQHVCNAEDTGYVSRWYQSTSQLELISTFDDSSRKGIFGWSSTAPGFYSIVGVASDSQP